MEIEGAMPAPADAHLPLPAVQGSVGTATSLLLRTIQLVAASMCIVAMVSADDYETVPAFGFLVGAAAVEAAWSLGMAAVDLEMLLKDGPRKHWFVETVKFLDAIVGGTLFSAASASCGIYMFLRYDMSSCPTQHCAAFESAITRAYVAFASVLPCCLANWLNWLRSDQAIKIPTDWAISVLMISVALDSPSIALGTILNCLVPDTGPCTPTTDSGLLLLALILHISGGMLELIGYLLAGIYAPTTPGTGTDWPLTTCTLLVAVKWIISIFLLGAACATMGIQHLMFINDVYQKSTNIFDGIFCSISIVTGVMYVLSASFSTHAFFYSYYRRGRGQA